MKKTILLAFIALTLLSACKKSKDEVKPFSLSGKLYTAYWFTTSENVPYYFALDFKNDNEVEYWGYYGVKEFTVGDGKIRLNYSVENPNSNSPTIKITGHVVNGSYGTLYTGDEVSWTASYNRETDTFKISKYEYEKAL